MTEKKQETFDKKVPESVAIVAMGLSHADYVLACAIAGSRREIADETWAINYMTGVIQFDRAFIMDDLIRNPDPAPGTAHMRSLLNIHGKPIYTSTAYPKEYPTSVEYPLEDVLNCIGMPYLNGTVAYAVAYAILLGVKHIKLYGCDYTYSNRPDVMEKGRGCVETMAAIAKERGISVEVARNSSLFDANVPVNNKFYGYYVPIKIEATEEGKFKVIREKEDASS